MTDQTIRVHNRTSEFALLLISLSRSSPVRRSKATGLGWVGLGRVVAVAWLNSHAIMTYTI